MNHPNKHLKVICLRKFKNHINFTTPSCSLVIDQNIQTIVFINNSRTAWPTKILMPILSFSDNLLQNADIIFRNSVNNFEKENKTC